MVSGDSNCVRYIQDEANWSLTYDRRLFKEIRTISGIVLIVTASTIGSSLKFEAKPAEGSSVSAVAEKVFVEDEMTDLVYAEGWSSSLLQHTERFSMAHKLLDCMKVVTENGIARLEAQHYPERRMLSIALYGGLRTSEIILGSVEINEHHNLVDLRTIIKHELEGSDIPTAYRFIFRGSPCSLRQEMYRRAWECLPTCFLQTRGFAASLEGKDTGDAVELPHNSVRTPTTERAMSSASTGLPRAPSPSKRAVHQNDALHLPAFPVPTLGRIRETSNKLYLLHDLSEEIREGDNLRIGNLNGRTYTVREVSGKIVTIHPAFALSEGDGLEPIATNSPYLNTKNMHLFPSFKRLGYSYDTEISVSEEEAVRSSLKALKNDVPTAMENSDEKSDQAYMHSVHAVVHEDLWLWRLVNVPDERPLWKKEYDDGKVVYRYTHRLKNKLQTHFRVSVPVALLEVLCVDARCPTLAVYTQRADNMNRVPLEKFTQVVFKRLMEWHPQSPHGIEGSKWIKFLREADVFPDLRKPVRISQMDIIFKLEAKGPHGHSEKYVNYQGFCNILKKLALVRYPLDEMVPKSRAQSPSGRLTTASASNLDLPEQSFRRLIMMHITGVTSWLEPIWEEAKQMAISSEAKRYCAATRIAAFYRGQRLRYYFSIYIDCIVALQANIRRKLTQFLVRRIISRLTEDWIFRQRVHYATLLQSMSRRYIVRCRYHKMVAL